MLRKNQPFLVEKMNPQYALLLHLMCCSTLSVESKQVSIFTLILFDFGYCAETKKSGKHNTWSTLQVL